MDFESELHRKQSLINNELKNMLKNYDIKDSIENTMAYSLFAGGKRVRPTLCMAICEGLGGDLKDVLPFACSLEMIHTYSLIHDDLPAMDNDDLRRGKPTSHKVFGEAMAILAGDGLLNLSVEVMFNSIKTKNYDKKFIDAAEVIAKASGIYGMIGGQVKDIQNENKTIGIEELCKMHELKTGALIKAACVSGCIISGRYDMIEDAYNYGKNIGIAFQIVDDILDFEGDSKLLGKNTGVDAQRDKATFVTILGIEKSKKLALEYTKAAEETALRLDKGEFLREFTKYLLYRVN